MLTPIIHLCMLYVGKNGRSSDGGIFANTPIYTKLENNDLKLPACKPLPDSENNPIYDGWRWRIPTETLSNETISKSQAWINLKGI